MSVFKKFFKTTACALVAITAFAGAKDAFANIGQPKTSWEVGPIHIKGENGFQYCSMKNNFDNGTFLVFARDASGVNSIALDFQNAVLETGEEYNINLQIINGVGRKHSAIAASKQVLVLQMGRDHDFYESLNKKNQLNITMDGAELAYSLKGSGNALDSLGDCVSDLDTLTVDEYASRLGQKKNAVNKKKSLERDKIWAKNLSLKQEVSDLKSANAELEQAKNILDKKIAVLRDKENETNLAGKTLDVAGQSLLKTENLKLLSTLAEYEQKISGLEKTSNLSSKNDGDQRNIAVLKGEVLALRQQLKQQVNLTENVSNCSAHFNNAQNEQTQEDLLVDLLVKAHVAMAGDINVAQSQPGLKSYNWQSGVLFGGAQQFDWPSSKNFTDMAGDYITNIEGFCQGEFASSFGDVRLINGNQFLEAELACIEGNSDTAAAAVLFYGSGKNFTAVLHEGTTDQLYTAIAKRDAILDRLYQP